MSTETPEQQTKVYEKLCNDLSVENDALKTDLNKLREENERLKTDTSRLSQSYQEAIKRAWRAESMIPKGTIRIATTESPTECDEPCHVFDGSIKVFKCATSCAGLKNCEIEAFKKSTLHQSLADKQAELSKLREDYNRLGVKFDKELTRWNDRNLKLEQSLADKEAEISRMNLNEERLRAGYEMDLQSKEVEIERLKSDVDKRDKFIDKLGESDARKDKEIAELCEALKSVRLIVKEAGMNWDAMAKIDAALKPKTA